MSKLRVVIPDPVNLYLTDVVLDEKGMVKTGFVENGGWNFEMRNGECLAKRGNTIVNRWKPTGDMTPLVVPDSLDGSYNDVIAWANEKVKHLNPHQLVALNMMRNTKITKVFF